MAKSVVRFKVGGRRTELGKSVENLIKRMNRFAKNTESKVVTKDIRSQVREMIEKKGKTERSVIEELNKIRDERLAEMFVDKKTGELVTNVSSIRISPLDNIFDLIGFNNYDFSDHPLLAQWVHDMEVRFGDDLDDEILKRSSEITEALNTVVWGYFDKGNSQGLATALTRLYEASFGHLAVAYKQYIEENVDKIEGGTFVGRYYNADEYDD